MELSREEILLDSLLNGKTVDVVPLSRIEKFLLRLIDGTTEIPEPQSRVETYLYALCENGGISGGNSEPASTLILQDESGNEVVAVYVDDETTFDATANDIREGKVAVTESGVTVGEKYIPSYFVSEGTKVIMPNKSFYIRLPDYDLYDYTKLQAIICPFISRITNSVSCEKVVINDNLYNVLSTVSLSEIIINSENKTIEFGINNETDLPYLIRYFTFKEVY